MSLGKVRQDRGKPHTNVGEVSLDSASEIIRLSCFTTEDVFFDVGSGIDNVIAQVALRTPASLSVGIEVCVDVAALVCHLSWDSRTIHARMPSIHNICGDLRQFCVLQDWRTKLATVLFTRNIVFEEDTTRPLDKSVATSLLYG